MSMSIRRLVSRFGRPVPQLCMITNTVVNDLYERHSYLLQDLDQPWLSPENLQLYATAIHDKDAALNNCWGVVDGTVRPICRPKQNQRIVYNGHKRVHALKFQSVGAPNGLIANLFGPVAGKRHDSRMLAMSCLLGKLQDHSYSPTGEALRLYGEPAYPHRVHFQCPYVRVSVEWVFGDIATYFKFIDFKKPPKIGLSAVGKSYVICALLRNALTCLYGNTTSTYFELVPPRLAEYFQ